ncbi:hypothetical protein LTR53_003711 [Teratosphaeriaceae sp. CCFEE 6253]|nr:hypothetical protein LTR53_003711 [Teratosphaeriaceae sp. CCFEE 6253]
MGSQAVLAEPAHQPLDPQASISVPNFRWHSADQKLFNKAVVSKPADPPLGVLAAFSGSFSGTGFNTIFRPNSGPPTGTTFPVAVSPAPPQAPSENVLMLNLTTETLDFSKPLGSVPNRGLGGQSDVFLNGVPYVQTVNDVSNPATGKADGIPVGIHFEPGVWMHLPETTADPPLKASVVRMGSIPHGTTINAQSLEPTASFNGPPQIPPVDITPFVIGSSPPITIPFAAQTLTNTNTPRIPQDLSKFAAAGTITQEMIKDPNTVLRNANKGKTIVKTQVFTVSTTPPQPEFGGGTANIAFLVGSNNDGPNANAVSMSATFWINTVQSTITPLAGSNTGTAPLRPVQSDPPHPGARVPSFVVQPAAGGPPAGGSPITVTHTEIQYSQTVFLNFAGLTWPHVSVATLLPTANLPVPLTK